MEDFQTISTEPPGLAIPKGLSEKIQEKFDFSFDVTKSNTFVILIYKWLNYYSGEGEARRLTVVVWLPGKKKM